MNRRIDVHYHYEEPSIGQRVKEMLVEWLIVGIVYLVLFSVTVGVGVWLLKEMLGV